MPTKYVILSSDKYKFNANARDKDHRFTKIHHIVAYSNVTLNIRMLQHSKVYSNIEHFYAPICMCTSEFKCLRIFVMSQNMFQNNRFFMSQDTYTFKHN